MQTQQNFMTDRERPLISFIVTYYNIPSEMLRECLASILSLSLKEEEREILLIDDGSKRSPIEDIKEYLDKIIYIRKANGGLSSARNMGIEACSGQYIQFIDADDLFNTPSYEHCLSLVREYQPDIVLFHLSDTRDDHVPTDHEGPVEGAEYMRHQNLRASSCGYIFRRKALAKLRFTTGILHEDEEFTPQLFLRADTVYTTEAKAYYYRKRQASITHENSPEWITKRLNDTRDIIFRLKLLGDTGTTVQREALQRRVSQLTMDYIYNIIKLTHDSTLLEERVAELTEHGLFPLPDRGYTKKYSLFRKASLTKQRRNLLCKLM